MQENSSTIMTREEKGEWVTRTEAWICMYMMYLFVRD